MAIAVGLLCALNVVLWIVFAVRFKRLFSTDDIISRTREELNQLLRDMNSQTDRNITLADDRIRQLKAAAAEADRRVKILKSELEATEKAAALQTAMQGLSQPSEPAKAQKATKPRKSRARSTSSLSPAERYRDEQAQGALFVSGEEPQPAGDGAESAMRKVPVIAPDIYMADIPVAPAKSFNEQVREKYGQGLTVKKIAADLGVSVQEVKLALEFS